MKLKLLGLMSVMILVLASCNDNENPGASGYGKISAMVTVDTKVSPSATIGRAGETNAYAPEIGDFSLTISKKDGSYSNTWSPLTSLDADKQFLAGAYTAEVFYGAIDEEGFDKPYYKGTAEFNVVDEETSNPNITATLQNTMISANYTEAFKKYFTDYSLTVHSDGGEYVQFDKDETRAAYVKPGNVELELTLTKTTGKTFTFNPASISNALPKTHYNVTFDVNGGEVGEGTLIIKFDSETVEEPIEVVLTEELINTPAPTAKCSGFTSGEVYSFMEGDTPENSMKMNLTAIAGLKEINMTVASSYLQSKGVSTEINLLAATEQDKTLLQNLGLKCTGIWNNPDKMAIIDFTELVKNLKKTAESGSTSLTVQVKDIYTKVSTPIDLKLEVSALELSLTSPSIMFAGQTDVPLVITYNGQDLEKNVKIYATNSAGSWVNCPITSVSPTRSASYTVHVTAPLTTGDVKFKAEYKGRASSPAINVVRDNPQYTLSLNEANVWSRTATVNVNYVSGADKNNVMTNMKVYLKAGNGTATEATNVSRDANSGTLQFSSLTPNTKYTVSSTLLSDKGNTISSNEITFTTEAETQIAYANMESWYTSASGTYWWRYVCGENGKSSPWGTLNEMTTGAGANYSYTRPSGTLESTSAHTGSKAALIRTVGWGSGNTAGGNSSVVYNVSSGELYLGSYNSSSKSPNYGISFTSRPQKLKFYYKYTPTTKVSGDYLVATIVVLNSAGNEIGKGTFTSTASESSYKEQVVGITYSKNEKAAKMYISFKSSGNSNCIKRDALKLPGFGLGHEKDVSTGSQLWIDDVTLEY